MKKIIVSSLLILCVQMLWGQDKKRPAIGWFVAPEVGGIFHSDHLGRTVGASLGIKLFNDHLKIGIQGYGRSGPINPDEFLVEASGGQTYKGSSTLRLRADHGVVGLFIAPTLRLKKIQLDLPIGLGQLGAGFYLNGTDRETPDGRRVSAWENQLMDGRDAGFAGWIEVGARALIPLNSDHLSLGVGLHYTWAPGWQTYYNPDGSFYNNRLRLSIVVQFESQ